MKELMTTSNQEQKDYNVFAKWVYENFIKEYIKKAKKIASLPTEIAIYPSLDGISSTQVKEFFNQIFPEIPITTSCYSDAVFVRIPNEKIPRI